jgi:hypothetical protein
VRFLPFADASRQIPTLEPPLRPCQVCPVDLTVESSLHGKVFRDAYHLQRHLRQYHSARSTAIRWMKSLHLTGTDKLSGPGECLCYSYMQLTT